MFTKRSAVQTTCVSKVYNVLDVCRLFVGFSDSFGFMQEEASLQAMTLLLERQHLKMTSVLLCFTLIL